MLRFFQSLFASMSLERKCLLFFGSALVVLMCGAFCVVLLLADRFVRMTTQQQARDVAATEMMLLHADAIYQNGVPSPRLELERQQVSALRSQLLSEDIEFDILGLEDPHPFDNLEPATPPGSPAERQLLAELEVMFRTRMANRLREDQPGLGKPVNLAEDAAMSRIGPGNRPLFKAIGPIQGRYIYYEPVFLTQDCIACHTPTGAAIALSPEIDPETRAAELPFRVKRVSMPDEKILNDTNQIRAAVVAMAMLIVAVTLFVLHAIVRYLVLQPLLHLRDVSDAITHGDTNQRAVIDTEDEFRELADAFNRMLRHLTETQTQLQSVNRELDARVDQFAQLNLQLYEANRLKTDFLANMSHELRTPLNSIIGFSEVLQGIDSLEDKQRRYATNIQKSGRLLLEMINDILDLAKVEAGKMEVRLSEFQISRLISAQCDMIQSLSEDKNISLSIDVPEDLPSAYQDPNKLGQIINNLLSNAIKFTPEGGMITIRVADLGDGRFRMSVIDTGVGIAEEDQPIIFEKFRQSTKVLEGDGLTREFAGTGLGLSIVKELSILLGGEIDFESELGRGSTFWVTLPYRLGEQDLDESPATLAISR
ncbi:sensor histidine kinase [Allorhodopirellula heiligendammensis]|uniref:histidine kinase n=1 Tax=Allorhodopirellula heiligendammensis TaxID=2714739 RepID=A0A5C6C9L8_9BACT|nr:Signal transduction histidine-protein kinase BarA [Allorhodopirellula heiligendammensis]